MKVKEIHSVLDDVLPISPVLLLGSPGIGKSETIANYAKSKGRELIIEHPAIADPTDYKGLPAIVDGKAKWLPTGQMAKIVDPSCSAIVLLDDLGQATPAVQAACMQLLLARRLGDHQISPKVSFIAASNRPSDRSGVRSILAALTNRVLLVNLENSAEDWANWALGQQDIDPIIAAYARFRSENLFADSMPTEIMAFCTPRSLSQVGRLLKLRVKRKEVWEGLIGISAATDLLAYTKIADKLPSISQILDNPKCFDIPKQDPGLLHAVVCLIAKQAIDYPEKVINFVNYLNNEWGVSLLSDSCTINPKIKKLGSFAEWAKKHKDVLL